MVFSSDPMPAIGQAVSTDETPRTVPSLVPAVAALAVGDTVVIGEACSLVMTPAIAVATAAMPARTACARATVMRIMGSVGEG